MSTAGAAPRQRPNYGRWRAATLIGVHVLIGLHIAHWQITGRSLAPLEFNEVMHTVELGLVTAGFLLMATAVLATAFFGRFFCGWACHLLALQDLCTWLLGKLGIAAKPIRSRVLRIAPFIVMGYMFLWPHVLRLADGEPLPPLRVAGPDEAWASFVTDDFWRNLPGPWIAGLTFLICGFVIVYLLGSRSFCNSACPYGALFGIADRLAPGRIVLRGTCTDCGKCTAACQSGIWVHEEVQHFGRVVDPVCLKDLDCVAVCPEGALAFGLARPAGFASFSRQGRKRRGHHWSLGEDLLAGTAMLATILVFRGLYEAVPFLMAVGLGCLAAASVVLVRRLWRAPDLRWRGLRLRRGGRLTGVGLAYTLLILVAGLFSAESALVRWHEFRGAVAFEGARTALAAGPGQGARQQVATAIAHHEAVDRWGLWNPTNHHRRLASLYALAGAVPRAEPHLVRILADDPEDDEARLRLAAARVAAGRPEAAATELYLLEARAMAGALPRSLLAGAVKVGDRIATVLRERGAVMEAERVQRSADRFAAAGGR